MKNWCAVAGVVLVCGLFAARASGVYDPAKLQAHGVYAELAQDPVLLADGWEYIVDFYTNGGGSTRYGIWGPETLYENMTNLDEGADWYWGTHDLVMQFWDQSAAMGLDDEHLKHPSQDTNNDDVWELTGHPWKTLNEWHLPSDYASGWEINHTVQRQDVGDQGHSGSTLGQDLIEVTNVGGAWGHGEGLWFTLRIVSSEVLPSLEWSLPYFRDSIDWSQSAWLDHPDYVPGLGVDFDHDGNNDVFHENYGVYPIVGNYIPEPATMSLLALGGVAVLRRRKM